jgi:hypothetical protein
LSKDLEEIKRVAEDAVSQTIDTNPVMFGFPPWKAALKIGMAIVELLALIVTELRAARRKGVQ